MKTYLQIFAVVLVFLLFNTQYAYAQPANDYCSGSQTVTPDGSCVAGTTVLANDTWTGTVGCQSGNGHPDAWYSFVATNTDLDVTVTNGTMTGGIEFTLVSSTSACSGLVLVGSLCGASPLTGTITGLTIGVTYYYTISSSTASQGTFTTCVNSVAPPPPAPGQDCNNAQVVCDNSPISVGLLQLGNGLVNENYGCIGAEQSSQWYNFTATTSGTFEVMISPVNWTSPNGGGDDYDWSFFDITSGCPTSGSTPLACNYNFCPGSTGFSGTGAAGFGQVGGTDYENDNPPGPGTCVGGPQWVTSTINLVAGNTYGLFVQNYSASTGGVNITFGGTATMGQPATFTTSLDVTCMTVTVDRTPFYTGTNSTYFWNYGDGFTSTAGVPGPHTYASTGNYTLSLTVTDAVGCITTFSVQVNIGCVPLPIKLTSFTGKVVDNVSVELDWITESEMNNDYFTIEKSKDGKVFEVVGIVNGANNSSVVQNYNMKDKKPYYGTSYYRLKQTDYDDNYSYSKLVSLKVDPTFNEVSIYPNPVQKTSYLSLNAALTTNATIIIYDVVGRIVLNENHAIHKGNNIITLATAKLTQGMYFVTLNNGFEKTTLKFTKNG